MKRIITFFLLLAMLCTMSVSAFANGTVSYEGKAGGFIFGPGSEHSLTDLFPDFHNVMPGDSLQQSVTVKNNANQNVKVEIYIRALGAREGSEAFLSQLKLRVAKSGDNTMAYMFDAYANETAQLTDWVCLGMLYSGGEVNLDVFLDVPIELDNEFQDAIGYLDWEFKVVEYPVEPDDPRPPQTGDDSPIGLFIGLAAFSAVALAFVIVIGKKQKKHSGK